MATIVVHTRILLAFKILKYHQYNNPKILFLMIRSSNAKRILEINPHHPVIKELLERVKEQTDEADKETVDMATLLYEAASLNSGKNIFF